MSATAVTKCHRIRCSSTPNYILFYFISSFFRLEFAFFRRLFDCSLSFWHISFSHSPTERRAECVASLWSIVRLSVKCVRNADASHKTNQTICFEHSADTMLWSVECVMTAMCRAAYQRQYIDRRNWTFAPMPTCACVRINCVRVLNGSE